MIRLASVLSVLVLLASCTSEASSSGNMAGITTELQKVLTSITDGKTAEQAKGQVTTLTDQLGKALETAKAAATAATEKGGDLGKLAGDLAGKAGDWLSPELKQSFSSISTEVTRLLGNEEIKNVLGATLEKLKGLLPSAG
jgi:hypothetical protein